MSAADPARPGSTPFLFVLFGPGGAGKGTLAARLVAEDPRLWLSRSWTTRPRRPDESPEAYEFVDRATFERRVEEGGFFEWAEFLGHLYGTPQAEPPAGKDLLLEIDLQGAQQVRAQRPDATLVLLLPPSSEAQADRMRARGDDEDRIAARLEIGREEERTGRELADAVVVNADLSQATTEVAGIVVDRRSAG